MSGRTWDLAVAVVLFGASVMFFVLMFIALLHHDYSRATFDLLLAYGANEQAKKSADRAA